MHTIARSMLRDREQAVGRGPAGPAPGVAVGGSLRFVPQAGSVAQPDHPEGLHRRLPARSSLRAHVGEPTTDGRAADGWVQGGWIDDAASIERGWVAAEVRRAIDVLPPPEQSVARLAHIEGLTHREIASRLRRPRRHGEVADRSGAHQAVPPAVPPGSRAGLTRPIPAHTAPGRRPSQPPTLATADPSGGAPHRRRAVRVDRPTAQSTGPRPARRPAPQRMSSMTRQTAGAPGRQVLGLERAAEHGAHALDHGRADGVQLRGAHPSAAGRPELVGPPAQRGEVAHQLAEGVQLVEDGGAGPLTVGREQPEGARRRDAQPVDHGRAELRARRCRAHRRSRPLGPSARGSRVHGALVNTRLT